MEVEFSHEVERSIEEARKLGYNPTRFRRMMAQDGLMTTARRLLEMSEPSEGLYSLVRLQRADLSLEALVLKYSDLFTQEEISVAQKRLKDVGAWK